MGKYNRVILLILRTLLRSYVFCLNNNDDYIDNNNNDNNNNNNTINYRNIFRAYKILQEFINTYKYHLDIDIILNMIHYADFSKYIYTNKNTYLIFNNIVYSSEISEHKIRKILRNSRNNKEYKDNNMITRHIPKWQLLPRYFIHTIKLKQMMDNKDLAKKIADNLSSKNQYPLYYKKTMSFSNKETLYKDIYLYCKNNKHKYNKSYTTIIDYIYFEYMWICYFIYCDIELNNILLDKILEPIINICMLFGKQKFITYENIILNVDDESKKIISDALVYSGTMDINYMNYFLINNNILL